MTDCISEHVARYVAMRKKFGCCFTGNARLLQSFARFAEARNETLIHSETALAWATSSVASSPAHCAEKLRVVRAFACWLHAQDTRHEVPPRDVLRLTSVQRPAPNLLTAEEIGKLLTAALAMPPVNSIAPLTWHYLFGLIAATGLRIGEALALRMRHITDDGLIIENAKFGKTRLVALHPTTRTALDCYLEQRRKEPTASDHLFVVTTGRPPTIVYTEQVFRKLAEQTGLREVGAPRGATPHSLRHSFAVRSLENLEPGADSSRHMLALATYLGHSDVSHTYWYLEATPVLLRGIAKTTEHSHAIECGGCHD